MRWWAVTKGPGLRRGVDIARAMCPPKTVTSILMVWGGPLDGLSDGLRRLCWEDYVRACRDELTGAVVHSGQCNSWSAT